MNEDNNTRHEPEPEPIPHELISEILTRLPVKSLTRFRSVSTRWNSTITHPTFSKFHFHRRATAATTAGAPATLILTFINRFTSERTILSLTIPTHQTGPGSVPNPTRILTIPGFAHPFVSQSLNGLICFNLGSMCVCNPSTRKYVNLPWTQPATSSLAPESTRHRSNAFGFDPVSNAHKVLDTWITWNENDIITEHRVFTIGAGSGEWRSIAGGPPYLPFNESVCINGRIYFRAFLNIIESDQLKPVMVAFDVNSERFRLIEMIDDPVLNSEESVVIEYDGNLAVVDHQSVINGEDNVIIMWILVQDEWAKKSVSTPAMHGEMKDRRRFKFAGTTGSGEMIFADKRLAKPFCVLLYDIKKNEVKKVEVLRLEDFEFNSGLVLMSVNEHVESVMCLS